MKWKRVRYQRKKIATKHIKRLLELSLENVEDRPERSRRYVKIARDIIRKHKVKLTSDQKRKFCKECNTPLVPGKTARVRVGSGMVSITCLNCGHIQRYPFRREKRLQRTVCSSAEKKFPGGLVCVKVFHKGELVRSVKITGDFFFYPEDKLFELEDSLSGKEMGQIGDTITEFYEKEGIESPGVGPESFSEVIRKAVGA